MEGMEGLWDQGRVLGSALSPGWLSRTTCGRVGLFIIPRVLASVPLLRWFPLPPASLSPFPFVYILSIFKTCPCATIFKGAFFPPSSCSQPFHCTTKAHRVHLINTLVTNSAAAQLLVSKSGALPAGETFQGSGAILLCPQGWALSGTAAVPA